MKAQSYSWPPTDGSGAKDANKNDKKPAANPWGSTTNDMADSLFGGHYGSAAQRGQSSQSSQPPEATIEQMQAQTDRHAQAIAESQQRMLKMAATTAETGAETLAQLHHQGEQLRHIQKEQAKIDENLSTSDKLLSSLESWRGAVKTSVSSWFGGSSSRPASARGNAPSASGTPPPPATSAAPPPSRAAALFGQPKQPAAAQVPDISDDDAAMSQLSGLVEQMHAQAMSMNAAIKDQSTLLDTTVESADRQQGKLDRNNNRAKKLIGR